MLGQPRSSCVALLDNLGENTLGRSVRQVLERTAPRVPAKGYLEVEIGLLVPSSANPRTSFDAEALAGLTASITTHGILQPIVVLKKEVGYEILAGHRRYLAAKAAGLQRVPVVIRDGDDPRTIDELRIVENIQRQDLNPIELAEAYQRLLTTHGLTHDHLADRVNKDRSSITNALRLLQLPPQLQRLVAEGALSAGHAKAIVGVTDPIWQAELARKASQEGLSVRATENLARLGRPMGSATTTAASTPSPAIAELQANLSYLLQTQVTIKERAGGKGSMTIHFGNRDQLNRTILILTKVMEVGKKPG